ncbi:hypothetical protein ACLBYG_27550 [Methylobacterium sp. D53M]
MPHALVVVGDDDILEDAGFLTFAASDGDTAMESLDHEHAAIEVASSHVQPGPDDMPEEARFIGKPFNGDMRLANRYGCANAASRWR